MFLSRKILLSVAAVGAAASIASLGTYATFTDSESATTGDVSTGTVAIGLGALASPGRCWSYRHTCRCTADQPPPRRCCNSRWSSADRRWHRCRGSTIRAPWC